MSDILDTINDLEKEQRAIGAKIVKLQHEYLKKHGWGIDCYQMGPTINCIFTKDDQMIFNEHEAIDYERENS